jgi:hypothetical protein
MPRTKTVLVPLDKNDQQKKEKSLYQSVAASVKKLIETGIVNDLNITLIMRPKDGISPIYIYMDDVDNLCRYRQDINKCEDNSSGTSVAYNSEDNNNNNIGSSGEDNVISDHLRPHIWYCGKYQMYNRCFRNEKNTKKFAELVSSGQSAIFQDTREDEISFIAEESKKLNPSDNEHKEELHYDSTENENIKQKNKKTKKSNGITIIKYIDKYIGVNNNDDKNNRKIDPVSQYDGNQNYFDTSYHHY